MWVFFQLYYYLSICSKIFKSYRLMNISILFNIKSYGIFFIVFNFDICYHLFPIITYYFVPFGQNCNLKIYIKHPQQLLYTFSAKFTRPLFTQNSKQGRHVALVSPSQKTRHYRFCYILNKHTKILYTVHAKCL